jgi:hypothetical protein
MSWKIVCGSALTLALVAGGGTASAAGHGHGGGGSHGGGGFHGSSHGGFHGGSRGSFHGGSFNSFHGSSFNGFHNGFHSGFHNGFNNGFRGGFGRGFHHHHHGFFPFFGFGWGYPFYWPYYGGYGNYYGGYGNYDYPYYNYPNSYDYSYPLGYNSAPTVIYLSSGYTPTSLPAGGAMPYSDRFGRDPGIESAPPPRPVQEDATYPYDGGPIRQVPTPGPDPDSTSAPKQPSVPLEGRAVSIPGKSAKYAYAAYGEGREKKAPAADKGYLVKDKEASKTPR